MIIDARTTNGSPGLRLHCSDPTVPFLTYENDKRYRGHELILEDVSQAHAMAIANGEPEALATYVRAIDELGTFLVLGSFRLRGSQGIFARTKGAIIHEPDVDLAPVLTKEPVTIEEAQLYLEKRLEVPRTISRMRHYFDGRLIVDVDLSNNTTL